MTAPYAVHSENNTLKEGFCYATSYKYILISLVWKQTRGDLMHLNNVGGQFRKAILIKSLINVVF